MATVLFPVWAVLASLLAFVSPAPLARLDGLIVPLLMVIMLTMGMGLTVADFARVSRRWPVIALAMVLQFGWMPAAAWLTATALGLSTELLIGLVLVGSVAGGTASNVMTYLARGDVALSLSMTATSTLISVALTPLLGALYLGETVAVPVAGMFVGLVQIVLAPVALGLIVGPYFLRRLPGLRNALPILAMAAIVLVIAIIVAINRDALRAWSVALTAAVIIHNGLGLALGYAIGRALLRDERAVRALTFEVGMQNSGLAVALATQYFTPASALPGAVFSIWHNLTGSALATLWRRSG